MKENLKTKNIWSLICKKVIVDDQTKLMSIIEVVERIILDINLSKAPKEITEAIKQEKPIEIQGELTVASYWYISKKDRGQELTLETIIKDYNLKELGNNTLTFNSNKKNSHQRTFIRFPALLVTGSGEYTITSLLKNPKGEILVTKDAPITIEINISTRKD
jgi:hypothetical protein